MPIFQNGRSPDTIRYIDPRGAEHQVVQVWLGDRLVWDGTTPALIEVPALRARVRLLTAAVRGAATAAAASPLTAAARLLTATPGGGGGVHAPSPLTATARMPEPVVSGAATVHAEPMILTARWLIAGAGSSVPGKVIASAMQATVQMPGADVHVPATVDALVLTASGELLAATVRAGALVSALTATGDARLLAAHLTAGARVAVPSMTARATMNAATPQGGARAVAAAPMSGSVSMPEPFVSALQPPAEFVASTWSSTTTATLTAAIPAEAKAGDFLVWIVTTWAAAPTTPAGWTLREQYSRANGTSMSAYTRTMTAGLPAPTLTCAAAGSHAGYLVVARGVSTVNASASTYQEANSTTHTAPSIATTRPKTLLLRSVSTGISNSGRIYAWAAGAENARTDRSTTGYRYSALATQPGPVVPGSTGTLSAQFSESLYHMGMTLALSSTGPIPARVVAAPMSAAAYMLLPVIRTDPFTPMGAYLGTVKEDWANETWFIVPLDSTMAGYPYTVRSGAAIVAEVGESTITAMATYYEAMSGSRVRLKVNGAVVATGAPGTATPTVEWSGSLDTGDLVTLEAYGPIVSAAARKIRAGENATYVTITPPDLHDSGTYRLVQDTAVPNVTWTQLPLTRDAGWPIVDGTIALPPGPYTVEWSVWSPGWQSDWQAGIRTSAGDSTVQGIGSSAGWWTFTQSITVPADGKASAIVFVGTNNAAARILPADGVVIAITPA